MGSGDFWLVPGPFNPQKTRVFHAQQPCQRVRSISARLELSCLRSKMISVPSGETSKSPITKLDGRSVSWRSAPVFGSQAQKFLWVYSPRRMTSEPELRENAGCAPRVRIRLGMPYGLPSGAEARSGYVVPTSAPE